MPMLTARNVFSSSFHLGHSGGADLHDGIDGRFVQGRGDFGARSTKPANHLRNVARVVLLVAGIDALGRKCEEELLVGLQSLSLEHRLHHFVGRARIRRRFENDQLTAFQRGRDGFNRFDDIRQIGVLRLPERRRDADVDDVHVRQLTHP